MEQFITEAIEQCQNKFNLEDIITRSAIGITRETVEDFLTSKLSQVYTLGKEEGKREIVERLRKYDNDWDYTERINRLISEVLTNSKTEELDPSKGGGGGH